MTRPQAANLALVASNLEMLKQAANLQLMKLGM
jgi:hypothetical protein